ncbi:DUF721 domain-containing protein [bacterium]|nr:DUF721 domain-containing protein [bacterium]
MAAESIQSVLTRCLKESGLEEPIRRYRTLQDWPAIVGNTIAAVTRPERISNGKLFVRVESDAWRNELIFYKKEILEKINRTLDSAITELILL